MKDKPKKIKKKVFVRGPTDSIHFSPLSELTGEERKRLEKFQKEEGLSRSEFVRFITGWGSFYLD